MQIFFVAIALTVSSLLLFRTVIKPVPPKFSVADRLTENGVLYDVSSLAARSTSTERSGGITARRVYRAIKRMAKQAEKAIARGEAPSAVIKSFYSRRADIISACGKAVRSASKSYLLGTVNGLPRIFSLCDSLVSNTRGAVTRELLTEAVRTYNKKAPLNFNEIAELPDMLGLCVCGLISIVVEISMRKESAAKRGLSDGAEDKVNLDLIFDDEYVCGLSSAMTNDAEALTAVLEHNGVSESEADARRRKTSAELAAIMYSCIDALDMISALTCAELVALSPCNDVLLRNEFYERADAKTRYACLEEVCRIASKHRASEIAAAHEIADIASLTHGSVLDVVFPHSGTTWRRIATEAAALGISASLIAVVTVFVQPMFLWFVAVMSTVIYSCADRLTSALAAQFFEGHSRALFEQTDRGSYGKIGEIKRAINDIVPVLQAVLIVACACRFDLIVFAVAALPPLTEFLCALFLSVVNASVKPFLRALTAVREFIKAPKNVVELGESACKVRLGMFDEPLKRVFQAIFAATVISLAAVYGNIVMIIVGAALVVPVFYDGSLNIRFIGRAKGEATTEIREEAEKGDVIEYFRKGSKYSVNLTDNADVFTVADSCGAVRVRNERISLSFDVAFETPSVRASLADCDGAFQRHKSVYRAKNADAEFCAEILTPPDINGCLCRVTMVNRSGEARSCEIEAVCAAGGAYAGGRTDRGIAALCDGEALGLYLSERMPFETRFDGGAATVKITLGTEAFSRRSVLFAAIFARDLDGLKRGVKRLDEPMCFERAEVSASVFASLGAAYDTKLAALLVRDEFDVDTNIGDRRLPTVVSERGARENLKRFGFAFNSVVALDENTAYCDGVKVDLPRAREIALRACGTETAEETFPVGAETVEKTLEKSTRFYESDERDYDVKTPFGGLLASGELCVDDFDREYRVKHTLADGDVYVEDGKLYCGHGDGYIAACDVAVGEDRVAPRVFGKDKSSVVYGSGYSRATLHGDGYIATLTRYLARGKNAEIFAVDIENADDRPKTINVMFFSRVGMLRPLRVGKTSHAVYVTDRVSGLGFSMLSSERIGDFTPYKEGYCRRDDITKISGLDMDGVRIAPAISIGLAADAQSRVRTAFALSTAGAPGLDRIDVKTADYFLETEKEFVGSSPIKAHTTDKILDYLYGKAFYTAYTSGFLRERARDGFIALSCYAAKYADIDEASAALVSSGKMVVCGSVGLFEMLSYVSAVKDHVDFVGCDGILEKRVDDNSTVADACVHALDTAIANTTARLSVAEYALLRRAVSVGCEMLRRKRYFAVANELGRVSISEGGDDVIALFARAVMRFEADRDDEANDLLIKLDHALFYGRLPKTVAMFGKRYTVNESDVYALYHAVVTKYLFGVTYKNGSVEFLPHVSAVSPHIEYELAAHGNKVSVVIADGEKRGAWRMRIGNITYAKNRLGANEKIDGRIVLFTDDTHV